MMNQVARLSVNLWDTQVHTLEQLSARIHEIVPLAQVETIETSTEHRTLWVSFEEASADAVESITALLQLEFNPNVYSYHWYPA